MKLPLALTSVVVCLASPLILTAQSRASAYGAPGGQTSQAPAEGRYTLNHAEFGVFADYFRFAPGSSSTNFVGAGARVGFSLQPNLAIEGEMAYDFARNYTTTETIPNGATTTTTFVTSRVRPLTGLFGPKLQFGTSGPIRIFATGKLGFLDFSTGSAHTVTGQQFTGAVAGIGGSGTHFAMYPGGGIEGFVGPIGLRAEVGDEIYLDNGTYNNWRFNLGPTLRF